MSGKRILVTGDAGAVFDVERVLEAFDRTHPRPRGVRP